MQAIKAASSNVQYLVTHFFTVIENLGKYLKNAADHTMTFRALQRISGVRSRALPIAVVTRFVLALSRASNYPD